MILEVSNLSHGFGDRTIFDNVSFRLLKGENLMIGNINFNGYSNNYSTNIPKPYMTISSMSVSK